MTPHRRAALLAEVRARCEDRPVAEICFVGFRQSRPIDDATRAYQPYVADRYALTRLANATLRCADAGLVPCSAARVALNVCAPPFIEAILACEPDVVLVDVRWGHHLAALLEAELPGAVFVAGDAESRPPLAQCTVGTVDTASTAVTIVLPTHNGSRYIRQSIASCLDQSHRNLELIVVDDGSRDDIAGIVGEFGDARIRYIRHETNRGLPAALNTGFRHATGELMTWTSDDNFYASDAIERMATFLRRHPGIPFVYTAMYIIDDTRSGAHAPVRSALPPAVLPQQNCVGACFLYTREVYLAIGEYDAGAVLVEDYDYWVRVSKRFRMQRLFAPLYSYRHHVDSLTSRHGTEAVAARFDMVRHHNGMA